MSAPTPNLFSCRLIAVVSAGREVLIVRRRATALWDLPGGDLRVGEHPEAGIRRLVESDSSTVVAITGLVGIYNRCTPRLSVVFPARQSSDRSGRDQMSSSETRSPGMAAAVSSDPHRYRSVGYGRVATHAPPGVTGSGSDAPLVVTSTVTAPWLGVKVSLPS